MLHELRAFRDRYGHGDVTDGFVEPASDLNPDLVGWVKAARRLYQKVHTFPLRHLRPAKLGERERERVATAGGNAAVVPAPTEQRVE
jgi:hypothetical protein